MYVRIVTFRLAEGVDETTYSDLAAEVAPAFLAWDGLISKLWLADHEDGTYGGTYVFESKADADRSRGSEVFQGLGSNPAFTDLRIREFDLLEEPTRVTAGPLRQPTAA